MSKLQGDPNGPLTQEIRLPGTSCK
jgi:hypothetical protein